jgi:hypothetical protein
MEIDKNLIDRGRHVGLEVVQKPISMMGKSKDG